MSDNEDSIADLFRMAEQAMDFIEDNEDRIKKVFGDEGVSVGDDDPLKRVEKLDEKVEVAIHTDKHIETVGMDIGDGTVVLQLNGDTVPVDVPDDAQLEDASAEMKNGILNVRIPRNTVETDVEFDVTDGDDNGDS